MKSFTGVIDYVDYPPVWRNNMNDDNRFNNNNNHNAQLVQQTAINQLSKLGQQQYNPWQNEIDSLNRQLNDSINTVKKMLEQKKESELEILQLKLEVAQLRLALAKAEK